MEVLHGAVLRVDLLTHVPRAVCAEWAGGPGASPARQATLSAAHGARCSSQPRSGVERLGAVFGVELKICCRSAEVQ